jgi:hypothetical protein
MLINYDVEVLERLPSLIQTAENRFRSHIETSETEYFETIVRNILANLKP